MRKNQRKCANFVGTELVKSAVTNKDHFNRTRWELYAKSVTKSSFYLGPLLSLL